MADANGNAKLAKKIEAAAQAIWNLYADKANQEVYDQFCEDDEEEVLFTIQLHYGVAKRKYVNKWEPLFRGDIYDLLIVGLADELIYNGGCEL